MNAEELRVHRELAYLRAAAHPRRKLKAKGWKKHLRYRAERWAKLRTMKETDA